MNIGFIELKDLRSDKLFLYKKLKLEKKIDDIAPLY